jgi:DNA-binding CsgD family transcriptional regulator
VRFPVNDSHWKSLRAHKSVFLHKNAPDGWWEEYEALAQDKFRPALFLARSSLASYTWTEAQRLFEPVGVDRWAFELALKHGMRDGLTCPIGGRWAIAFWSRRALSKVLTTSDRIMIFAAASFAALRLEQLIGPDAKRIGSRTSLTSRELAVLRFVSTGAQNQDIAQALGLSEETIRSHLKKAQAKLGVRSRAHAACEAIRQNLIP